MEILGYYLRDAHSDKKAYDWFIIRYIIISIDLSSPSYFFGDEETTLKMLNFSSISSHMHRFGWAQKFVLVRKIHVIIVFLLMKNFSEVCVGISIFLYCRLALNANLGPLAAVLDNGSYIG